MFVQKSPNLGTLKIMDILCTMSNLSGTTNDYRVLTVFAMRPNNIKKLIIMGPDCSLPMHTITFVYNTQVVVTFES